MEKCYKYETIKGMKKLFNDYNRDYFSNVAYKFMINFMNKKGIKQFDVIQLCEMFTETKAIELFGKVPTTLKESSELKKALKLKRSNIFFSNIDYDNNIYIVWYSESLKEMYNINSITD